MTSADSSINPDDRAYKYDAIGNRLKSAESLTLPASNNYTPNALNLYTAINALNPSYDADGNMTSGPLPTDPNANSVLVWDGENRLMSATVNGVVTTYVYDSQSHRVAKTTNGTSVAFVYDGWNVIAEYGVGGTSVPAATNLWGLDLSGSLQRAGGVGGLLARSAGAASLHYAYDANGNITELFDNTGAIAAHYEYGPFGEVLRATGIAADNNPYKFSTKYQDSENGLMYYGYRYYDVSNGRWISRDPKGEMGGVNLFSLVRNQSVTLLDPLGLDAFIFYSSFDQTALVTGPDPNIKTLNINEQVANVLAPALGAKKFKVDSLNDIFNELKKDEYKGKVDFVIFISHGAVNEEDIPRGPYFGTAVKDNLLVNQTELLGKIGAFINKEGIFATYSCDTGKGPEGKAIIEKLDLALGVPVIAFAGSPYTEVGFGTRMSIVETVKIETLPPCVCSRPADKMTDEQNKAFKNLQALYKAIEGTTFKLNTK